MRVAQLRAVLWMRWRTLANRVQRGGKLGNTLFALLMGALVLLGIGGFLLGTALGVEFLPDAKPLHIMLVWGLLVVVLLFTWTIGVVTELQRSDAISLGSLLHLPASLLGVHLYNYLSSFVSVSLLVFLPPMLGFALASVWVIGPVMLLLFPLIAGMVGLLGALTFQLRGWLGTMIHDKRKRRNVVMLLTLSFALLAQLPNLAQIAANRDVEPDALAEVALESEVSELESAPEQGDEAAARTAEPGDRRSARRERKEALLETWATRASIAVPFGWLPYGARALMEGRVLAGLLCLVGLFALTGLSLRRSYRTTLRFVTGVGGVSSKEEGSPPEPGKPRAARASRSDAPLFVARRLPFVDEACAGVALAGMKSLWRAPEFKMVLLTPLLMLMFGGVAVFSGGLGEVPERMRPLAGLGGMFIGLFTMMQLLQNQFGLDRQGFRAFVLSPVPRDRILQGKNLAVAPFCLGLSALVLIAVQIVMPMDLSHFLATWMLLPAGYLITCLAANLLSILAPMRLKEGVMKPENGKFLTGLMHAVSLLGLPILLLPLFVPMGLEFLAGLLDLGRQLPVYLLASGLVLGLSVWAYRLLIPREGELLQTHEQRILELLTRTG